MIISGKWQSPILLSTSISYAELKGLCGLYCIAISDNYYIEYPLGKNKIVYFGSGDLYSRLNAHSNPQSWTGNDEVHSLLESGYFLEVSVMILNELSDEELRSLEGDLIEEFEERFGKKPIGNRQIPSKIEGLSLDQNCFKIITKYTF